MSNLKPWYNMFPHSNYSQFNLDWLISKYGEYDQRIKTVEDAVADHEERIQAAEADIDDLQGRMETAESDIDALEGRMDTAEGDIDALEGRMDTAEGDIDSLEGRMDTAEGDIDTLEGVVGNANSGLVKDVSDLQSDISAIQQDIIDIGIKDQAQDNDIEGLDSRVEALENESAVIANPGGTGANLNTISINDVTYVIPSGGGGGGGSSVTPNPAGTPTDTLDKVDIDGIIYGMPITAAEVTALDGDISDLQDDVGDIQDVLENDINYLTSWTGSSQDFEGAADNTVQDISPNDNLVLTEPGMYLFTVNSTFDTRNYGSTPRDLGLYLRQYHPNNPADPGTNLTMVKGHVNGSENAMITQAYNMNLSYVFIMTGYLIHNGFNGFKTSFRCQSSTTKNVEVSSYPTCIKLNGVDLDPYQP